MQYEFKLVAWNGIPAEMGEVPAPHEFSAWIERAAKRKGHGYLTGHDTHSDAALMRRIVAEIKPDDRGIKPVVKVVESAR
jgi:hypothetical protein